MELSRYNPKVFFLILIMSLLAYMVLPAQQSGKLVVFVDNVESPKHIQADELEALRSTAGKMKVDFELKAASEGLPKDVAILPSIYFQNHLGRSLYKGRYTNTPRLGNFIRTAKYLPSRPAKNIKQDILIHRNGRATLGSPLKITEVTGPGVPNSFDQKAFIASAIEAFNSGVDQFSLVKEIDFPGNGRLIYMAVYPYRDGKKLFLSTEMYSMFNCKRAIFKTDAPFEGTWAKRDELFKKAGQVMQTELMKQVASSNIGDAFTPVDEGVPEVNWSNLGLELPPAPEDNFRPIEPGTKLPSEWVVDGAIAEDLPMVQFAFLPPVDYYAGEAKTLEGTLELGDAQTLNGSKGNFKVPIMSISMGDPTLTKVVREEDLKGKAHPTSMFSFENGTGSGESLSGGQSQQVIANGTFNMVGMNIPLEVSADIQALRNKDGDIRLLVSTTYRIRLADPFGIDGPDGPSPANDTVEFNLNFFMKPKA